MQCETTDKSLRAKLARRIPSEEGGNSEMFAFEPVVVKLESIFIKEEEKFGESSLNSSVPEIKLKDESETSDLDDTAFVGIDDGSLDVMSQNSINTESDPVRVDDDTLNPEKVTQPYTCPTCMTSFTDSEEFNIHLKTHRTSKLRYECPHCDLRFQAISTQKRHIENVHSGKSWPCEICNKKLSSKHTLTSHIRECHEKKNGHECKICGRVFYRRSNMVTHMKLHASAFIYGCDQCPSTFKTLISLGNHKRTHKSKEKNDQQEAGKSKISDLETAPQSNNTSLICEHCGKKSQRLATHLAHLRVHTGEKPFVCTVCNKAFNQRTSLDFHKRVHTGEKPHVCEFCGMCFRQIGHLKTHLQSIHEQARPHKCSHCDKAFSSAGNLRTHARLHTGERPFECQLCPRRFIDINGLKRHRRSGHKDVTECKDMKVEQDSMQDDEKKVLEENCDEKNDDVEKHDPLPKRICSNCEYRLEMAYDFKLLCEVTDQLFRAKFAPDYKPEDGKDEKRSMDALKIIQNHQDRLVNQSQAHLETVPVKEEIIESNELEDTTFAALSCTETVLEDVDIGLMDEMSHMENPLNENPHGSTDVSQESGNNWTVIVKTYDCPICKATFNNFQDCDVHTRTHGKFRFPCMICNKKFATNYQRNRHAARVHATNPLSCELCNKQLGNIYTLRCHLKEVHEKRNWPACDICGQVFSRKNHLQLHMRHKHKSDPRYGCDQRPSTSKTDDGLISPTTTIDRSVVHEEGNFQPADYKKPPPYVCEFCGRENQKQYNHLSHLRTHTGEKPFACTVCDKRFSQNSTLRKHWRVHTGERPYSCDLCGMTSNRKDHLRRHMRIVHENSDAGESLQNSILEPSADGSYECRICWKRFVSIESLQSHISVAHVSEQRQQQVVSTDENVETNNEKVQHSNDDEELVMGGVEIKQENVN